MRGDVDRSELERFGYVRSVLSNSFLWSISPKLVHITAIYAADYCGLCQCTAPNLVLQLLRQRLILCEDACGDRLKFISCVQPRAILNITWRPPCLFRRIDNWKVEWRLWKCHWFCVNPFRCSVNCVLALWGIGWFGSRNGIHVVLLRVLEQRGSARTSWAKKENSS
jgi:hypothetical protein